MRHHNNVRLNSATGYITPKDMLAGRQQDIYAERDRKLEAARRLRSDRHHPLLSEISFSVCPLQG